MALVAHYKLNDNLATTAILDATANAFNGVAVRNSALTYAAGKVNGAWHGGGSATGDIITVPYAAGMFSAALSVAFWYNSDIANYSAFTPYVVSTWTASKRQWAIGIGTVMTKSNKWSFSTSSTGTSASQEWETVAIGTGWHHLAITRSAAGATTVYHDGTKAAGPLTFGGFSNRSCPLTIGGYGVALFTGLLDDLRYYNEELSLPYIQAIYAGGAGTEESAPAIIIASRKPSMGMNCIGLPSTAL